MLRSVQRYDVTSHPVRVSNVASESTGMQRTCAGLPATTTTAQNCWLGVVLAKTVYPEQQTAPPPAASLALCR